MRECYSITRYYVVKRPLTSAVALVTLSALASGCMDAVYEVDVQQDGSGQVEFGIIFDVADLTTIFESSEIANDLCDGFLESGDLDSEQLDTGSLRLSVELVRDNDRCGAVLTGSWVSPEDIPDLQTIVLPEEEPTPALTKTASGGWRYDARLPLNDLANELFGPVAGFAYTTAIALGTIDPPSIDVSVTLPGEIVDHNGTIDGSTVSWSYEIDFLSSDAEQPRLIAESAPASGGARRYIVFAGLVVAVGGAAALFFKRRPSTPGSSRGIDMHPGMSGGYTDTDYRSPSDTVHPSTSPPTGQVSTVEPGWYDDPFNVARVRWWDGVRWTEHTAE